MKQILFLLFLEAVVSFRSPEGRSSKPTRFYILEAVKLREIGLDIQERRSVEDIQVADAERVAPHIEQTHG